MTRRLAFRSKLVLLAVLVEVCMLSLLVWNSVRQMQDSLIEQAELRMQQVAATLRPSLISALTQDRLTAVQELVAVTRETAGLARLAVYDDAGDLLAESVDGSRGREAGLLRERVELELAGLHYGRLEITVSDQFLRQARRDLIRESVLIAFAEVCVSTLLLTAAGLWLTRHLDTLRRATAAWARGDLEARAPVTPDEVGQLAAEFNRMADALGARMNAVNEARERFRAIADYTYSWESWIGPNGELRWINPSVERITGYTVNECLAIEDYPFRLVHPADHSRCRQFRQRAARGESGDGEQLRIVTKSGEIRWVRVSWQPIYSDTGENLGTRASVLDITRLKDAESALRQSEARFLEAERVARLGHWEWDLGSGVLHWSDETYRILGMDPTEFRPTFDRLMELIPPEDRTLLTTAVDRALADDNPIEVEHRVLRSDGAIRHLLERGRVERDLAGKPVLMFGTVQDITERKEAQLALARLNRLYAVLSETNKAVVRERSVQALFERVCRIAVEVGGLRLAWIGRLQPDTRRIVPIAGDGPAVGYVDGMHVSLSDEPSDRSPTAQALLTGRTQVSQSVNTDHRTQPWRQRAEQWRLRSIASVLLSRYGAEHYTLTVYSDENDFFSPDIIELLEALAADVSVALQAFAETARRREAEAELIKLNAELEARVEERTRALEAANRELEAFSYSVSHDLRAPLRSIDGFSRYLSDHYADQLDATGRDYFERIMRASRRMGQLIDDLLMLSRIGRQDIRVSEVSLTEIARGVVDELQHADPQRRVRVEIEDGLRFQADAQLIRIVLENLLGNAWKFSARNPEAVIRFGAVQIDGERALVVRDNGAGFDGRYVHKLFAPFQRLHANTEFEGTGIGLATVQRIIAKHGGRVWAEGEVGVGASFFFTLEPALGAAVTHADTTNTAG